jgi:hypothetical protein
MQRTFRQQNRSLLALLAFAFALRCVVVLVRWDNLSIDRDAYLAIAENLVDGKGFCSVPGRPTAFRPPLYPLLLAGCLSLGGVVAVGAMQIILGTATVGLTWRLVCNTGFSARSGLFAGLLVAVDPLLLEMTSQPMTETLFVFLTTALLCSLTGPAGLAIERPVVAGVLTGLAGLCRPSIWVFISLLGIAVAATCLLRRLTGAVRPGGKAPAGQTPAGPQCRRIIAVGIAAALVVSPWVFRNWSVFGRPILMTTHGGYTLALGNNEFFDADVIAGGERVWSEAGLRRWQQDSERRIAALGIEPADELAHDAALSRQAIEWIRAHPQRFAAACWLRVTRFWAVRPQRDESGSRVVSAGVGFWYAFVLAAAVVGVFRNRRCLATLAPSLLLAVSLTLLHSAYWSNMRMRAPLVPVVSLLAVSAMSRFLCRAGGTDS